MLRLQRCFTPAVILLAVAIAVALPLLALFNASRSAAEIRLAVEGGRVPVALWTEHHVDGEDGSIVQRGGMPRWRAQEMSDDLGAGTVWGLLVLRDIVGRQADGYNRHLRIAEIEESLASAFGLPACDGNLLHPLPGHALTGTLHSPDIGAAHFGPPLTTSLSALFAASVDVAAARCVPALERGDYLIAVLRDMAALEQVRARLRLHDRDLFGSGFREVVRVEPVALARGNVHAERARLLGLAGRSLLAMLAGIAIVVAAIEVLGRRQALAIGFMLGGNLAQQARRAVARLLPGIAGGLIAGMIATWLLPSHILQATLDWRALAGAALAVVPAALLVTVCGVGGVGKGLARASAVNITQSPLVIAGFQGFWCLISALLVVVVGLQMAVAARVVEATRIDWGYAPEGLLTLRIALPEGERDAQAYRDRLMTLLDGARRLPGVSASTVVSPAPWRFHGIEHVDGNVATGLFGGPAFLETLGVRRFDGEDIDAARASAVLITQNMPEQHSRMLFREHTRLATMQGLRWNPFDATPPVLSILSIFDDPQARFEWVVRTRGSAPVMRPLMELAAETFPDAAIGAPEKVADVIAARYAPLTALLRVGSIVALATLTISLLLASLVFAQVFAMQRREFAVRICLGASHWNALRPWRRRVVLLALAGCLGGVFVLGYVNRLLVVSVSGFVPSDAAQAGVAVATVLALTVVTGIAFAWNHLRRLDPAQALRL